MKSALLHVVPQEKNLVSSKKLARAKESLPSVFFFLTAPRVPDVT